MLSCPYNPNWALPHVHNVSVAHFGVLGKGKSGKSDHAVVRIVLSFLLKLCKLTALSPIFPKLRPQKSDNQPSILKKAS